jgi:hypothetical protein
MEDILPLAYYTSDDLFSNDELIDDELINDEMINDEMINDEMINDGQLCVICLDNNEGSNTILPCECKNPIHRKCFYNKINHFSNKKRCEVCKSVYKSKFKTHYINDHICDICESPIYYLDDQIIKSIVQNDSYTYTHKSCIDMSLGKNTCNHCHKRKNNSFIYPCDCSIHEKCIQQYLDQGTICSTCNKKFSIKHRTITHCNSNTMFKTLNCIFPIYSYITIVCLFFGNALNWSINQELYAPNNMMIDNTVLIISCILYFAFCLFVLASFPWISTCVYRLIYFRNEESIYEEQQRRLSRLGCWTTNTISTCIWIPRNNINDPCAMLWCYGPTCNQFKSITFFQIILTSCQYIIHLIGYCGIYIFDPSYFKNFITFNLMTTIIGLILVIVIILSLMLVSVIIIGIILTCSAIIKYGKSFFVIEHIIELV